MLKSIYTAIALLAVVGISTGFAMAKQEKQVTRVIWELSDFPDLEKNAKAVCSNDKLVRSAKLEIACKANSFPTVTKGGAFRNAGIGAELNTLIRQAGSTDQAAK